MRSWPSVPWPNAQASVPAPCATTSRPSRGLYAAVFAAALDAAPADLRIRDATVPARERLRECLLQLLPPTQPAELSVDRRIDTISAVFGPAGAPEARTAWTSYAVRTTQQITNSLRVHSAEGAVASGSEERGSRFLLTVIDGMALARILPFWRGGSRRRCSRARRPRCRCRCRRR